MASKKKILVIEDDTFLGDLLLQKLKLEGYDATLVRDGAEGLKEIYAGKPSLILLDLVLPSMNGYEILEAKQKDPAIQDIPVIIVSNSGQPVEINRALALGVKDYLVKADLDPADVLVKVKKHFDALGGKKTGSLVGRRILWVEDDTFLSSLLITKLGEEGCVSLHAEDGEHALQILKTEHPDIILLDLLLPGMSGFDVLKALKEDEHTRSIPVVVLSNTAQQSDIDKTTALGAAKHLIKAHYDPNDIVNVILEIIGHS